MMNVQTQAVQHRQHEGSAHREQFKPKGGHLGTYHEHSHLEGDRDNDTLYQDKLPMQ